MQNKEIVDQFSVKSQNYLIQLSLGHIVSPLVIFLEFCPS